MTKPTTPPPGLGEAVSFAVSRGIVVSKSTTAPLGTNLTHAPFVYRPTPFSSSCYNHALSITVPLNYLVTRISRDIAYIRSALAETAAADADFTGRLLALLSKDDEPVSSSSPQNESSADATTSDQTSSCLRSKRIQLAISRFDYFQHFVSKSNSDANDSEEEHTGPSTPSRQRQRQRQRQPTLRMVELNCIAASFACLSTRLTELHRHLACHPAAPDVVVPDMAALPANNGTAGLARGLWLAHNEFVRLYPELVNSGTSSASSSGVAIALIVQPGERNVYDQFFLQEAVWRLHGVQVFRVTLGSVARYGRLDEHGHLSLLPENLISPATEADDSASGAANGDGDAHQQGEKEREDQHRIIASVVYFRAGYTPDDYPTEAEWEARALIERSTAAKCPTVAMQLVGTKKIQQLLDKPGEVERFLDVPGDVEAIRRTFARQYSLSEQDGGAEAARMGIEQYNDFVLKPQREGGGYNIYGTDIRDALKRMDSQERSAYVLMERIRPVIQKNVIVRDGLCSGEIDIVSEFGMYGVHVECDGKLVDSYAAGTLLRSKADGVDEGGVAAGAAALDSPMLTDWTGER